MATYKIFFLILFLTSFLSQGFSLTLPIDSSVITSSFGEYRKDRLHAGIDFSTNHKTGFPVRAYHKGVIYRIKYDLFGYGKALYLKHPDGTFSVYAHLDRLEEEQLHLESLLQSLLKEKNSLFKLDAIVENRKIKVEEGQIIAYSGETGAGPPHLHFELRKNIFTPYNPFTLPLFKKKIIDNKPPVIKEILVFPQTKMGKIEHTLFPFKIKIPKNSNPKNIQLPLDGNWKDYIFNICVYDLQQENNPLGIFYFKITALEKNIFSFSMENFNYKDVRKISFLLYNQTFSSPSHPYLQFPSSNLQLKIYGNSTPKSFSTNKDFSNSPFLKFTFEDNFKNHTSLTLQKSSSPRNISISPLPLKYYFLPQEKLLSFQLSTKEKFLQLTYPDYHKSYTFFPTVKNKNIITFSLLHPQFFLKTNKKTYNFYLIRPKTKISLSEKMEFQNFSPINFLVEIVPLKKFNFHPNFYILSSGYKFSPSGLDLGKYYFKISPSISFSKKMGLFAFKKNKPVWIKNFNIKSFVPKIYFLGKDLVPPTVRIKQKSSGKKLIFYVADYGKGVDWYNIKVTNLTNKKQIAGMIDPDKKSWTSLKPIFSPTTIQIEVEDFSKNKTIKKIKIKD